MKRNVVLQLTGIERHYGQGETILSILKGADFSLHSGEIVALVAPSGTGKSTLLHVAGLLEHPDAGDVTINGNPCNGLSDDRRTAIRRNEIGFVYQFHHLLPEFSAIENIMMPQLIAGLPWKEARERASQLLDYMRIGHRGDHRPGELSGGEQQRVAIARAVANAPLVLFADEPTGNLDTATGERIAQLLFELNRGSDTTLVLVTHEASLAARCGRVLSMDAGALMSDAASATAYAHA
jgi:lipoprotein-releasing system ATP-binding protein